MMTLTDQQLDEIKAKIEADKIRPIRAIRELHPDEDQADLIKQLFQKFPRKDLLELGGFDQVQAEPTPELTKEEQLAQIDKRIAKMQVRRKQIEDSE